LAHGFLLGEQNDVAAGFDLLAIERSPGRSEQRWTQIPKCDRGNPEGESREDNNPQATAKQAISAMTTGRTPPDSGLNDFCFGLLH
jgi:hypothetical protein